jgi:hypothetical protein
MAVWKDARVSWDGNVISSSVRALSLELGADAPEATAMGDNWRQFEANGLKTASVEMELNWAAGSTTAVDSLFGSTGKLGQSATLLLRPTTGSISASNPQYSGSFIVTGYTPMQGPVGDIHMANVSLQLAGALSRAIST